MLCAGQTVEKKIEHVLELVQTCSGQCLIVPLHLSLLYAWLGNQFESAEAYKRCVFHSNLSSY